MSRRRDLALFVALSVAWGLSFPAIRAGLGSFPPLLFAALRFGVAGVLLFGYLFGTGTDWRPRTRADVAAVAAAAAFVVAFGNGLLFSGQRIVPSGIASILYALIPVLTTGLAAALLPREPITPRRLVGVGFGFLGVGVIARPDPSNLLAAELFGIALVVAAAASVAFGSVLLRRLTPTLEIEALTSWAMLVGGGFLAVGSALAGEGLADVTPTPIGVVAVVYLAVFASALAYAIYFALLDRVGPLEINLVSYAVPVVATAAGVILFGEALTTGMVVGFGLIAGGFVIIKGGVIAVELRGSS